MYSDNFDYIVFTKGIDHWWTRFIHPTINHCYLMRPDRGRIIIFEKGLAEVKVYTIDEISDKLGNDLLIKWKPVEARQCLFMLNTCVGHIKQILGINKPFYLDTLSIIKIFKEKSCHSERNLKLQSHQHKN